MKTYRNTEKQDREEDKQYREMEPTKSSKDTQEDELHGECHT